RALVISEIALSLLLLTGARLMIESFRRVCGENLGIRPDNVLGLEVFLPPNKYPSEQPQKRDAFVNGVIANLKRLPGVQSAAATNFLPLTGFWGTADFTVEGQPARNPSDKPQADNRLITPGYFSTMGMALLRGRDFTDADRSGSQQVAIVNSTFGHRYFGA